MYAYVYVSVIHTPTLWYTYIDCRCMCPEGAEHPRASATKFHTYTLKCHGMGDTRMLHSRGWFSLLEGLLIKFRLAEVDKKNGLCF